VHEIAQAVAPDARVVYVDNDPIVLAHARALLASQDVGETAFILGDLREPQAIVDHPTLGRRWI
jgi:predicted O-methyltransferase YrrM